MRVKKRKDEMQGDLLSGFEEMGWEVLETKWHWVIDANNGAHHKFYTYAHTRPYGWKGPEVSDKLPWEE